MLNRVTFILAAVCTLTLLTLAGCVKTFDPAPEQDNPIQFQAGAGSLLLNDATKSGTPKTGFADGDAFFVYGIHNTHTPILFDGTEVGYDGTFWTYSPSRIWQWGDADDYYDFMAVTGPSVSSSIELTGTNPLRISYTGYQPTAEQYDLMAAAAHVQGGSTASVQMQFRHLLSAVSVTVYNDGETKAVQLNSLGFRGLVTRGNVRIEQNGNDVTGSWIPTETNNTTVLGYSYDSPVSISGNSSHPSSPVWDLMIPQSHALTAYMDIDYQYYDDDLARTVRNIAKLRLKDIKEKGASGTIDEWLPGVQYVYEIHINLDGGVRVSVITTQWDEIKAETPGLII